MANKADLVAKVVEGFEAQGVKKTKKEITEVVDALIEGTRDFLATGEDVSWGNEIGKFVVQERAERKGRNPQTGEELLIPATKVAKFKPSVGLKKAVKGE